MSAYSFYPFYQLLLVFPCRDCFWLKTILGSVCLQPDANGSRLIASTLTNFKQYYSFQAYANLFDWELHIQAPSRALTETQFRDIIFPLNILILNQVWIFSTLRVKCPTNSGLLTLKCWGNHRANVYQGITLRTKSLDPFLKFLGDRFNLNLAFVLG